MSERIKVDTEDLGEILRIIGECGEDFEGARVRIANSLGLNLEVAGETELGKVYAEGIRPGSMATAQLLDLIREIIEGAHGNGFLMKDALEQAAAFADQVAGGGRRGGGGRR